MTNLYKLVLLGVSVPLVACTTASSTELNTSGIYASMSATTTGNGKTSVSATLFQGDPIKLVFVELGGEDELVAAQGSTTKSMRESEIINIVSHYAEFDVDAVDTEFEISFLRGSNDDDATSNSASLPPPFDLLPVPATFSRAAEMTVQWEGVADEPMSWRATGPCIQTISGAITEADSVVIPANMIKKVDDPMAVDNCDVKLEVFRERDGQADSAFKSGSSMRGVQLRTTMFSSTP